MLNPRLEHVDKLCAQFVRATPFKHVVLDNFFEPQTARRLLDEFPSAGGESGTNLYGSVGKKTWHSNIASLGGAYEEVDRYFRSPTFLDWIGALTGIDGLLYDETNYGGGTHENFEGRNLLPHVDFNIHPSKKLHRRLNLIVYLNDVWNREWGGVLSLYNDPRDPLDQTVEYEPSFNRCVVFETSERSWHGFDMLRFPPEERARTRKSLSIYLYTRDRPGEEIYPEHTTFFVPRPLSPKYIAGLTLDEGDARELALGFGQRDRLIELYQAELSNREPEAELVARLRLQLAEAQPKPFVPLMGYAICESVGGRFPDGWSSERLTMNMYVERPVTQIRATLRLPQPLAARTAVCLAVDGESITVEFVERESSVVLTGNVSLRAGVRTTISIEANATVNLHSLGLSADRRDLGFYLDRLIFEHSRSSAQQPPIRPQQYAFVGDCHALVFDGLIFDDESDFGEPVVARARWEPFLTADRMFRDGQCTPAMTRMLYDVGMLRPRLDNRTSDVFAPLPMYESRDTYGLIAMIPRRHERVLAISCGVVEAHDIASEFATYSSETLDVETIYVDAERRMGNLFLALLALRNAGFSNLCLLAIPPPGATGPNLPPIPVPVLHAVTSIINSVYRAFCAEHDFPFVDAWDDLTLDGVRSEAFDRDGVHLNMYGAARIMYRLQTTLRSEDRS